MHCMGTWPTNQYPKGLRLVAFETYASLNSGAQASYYTLKA